MKKLVYGTITAAMMAAITACGSGDKTATAENDTLVNRATSDSISQAYGSMVGGYMLKEVSDYARMQDTVYNKADFQAGLKSVVEGDYSEEYLAGVNAGLSMAHDIDRMKKLGVQVNRKLLVSAMLQAFDKDSIDELTVDKATTRYDNLMTDVTRAAQERQAKRIAESPEATNNLMAARSYIKKAMADDPAIKKSETGLYYKIDNPGQGQKVGANDQAIVKFYATRLDGKMIDGSEQAPMIPGNGLLPGVAEGLQMLGKDGKATLYVPAELAYGAAGVPGSIGPNEMLIFIIEVTDINRDVLSDQSDNPAQ